MQNVTTIKNLILQFVNMPECYSGL